jgi:hypothetical protein
MVCIHGLFWRKMVYHGILMASRRIVGLFKYYYMRKIDFAWLQGHFRPPSPAGLIIFPVSPWSLAMVEDKILVDDAPKMCLTEEYHSVGSPSLE